MGGHGWTEASRYVSTSSDLKSVSVANDYDYDEMLWCMALRIARLPFIATNDELEE